MEHQEKPRRRGETQSQDNCCTYTFLELSESRMIKCDVVMKLNNVLGSHTIDFLVVPALVTLGIEFYLLH